FVNFILDIPVEEYGYPVFIRLNIFYFFQTIISYTHLYQFGYLGDILHGIIHNAGMAVSKGFITFPQVAVCIKMQDTEIAELFGYGFVIIKWDTVIAAFRAGEVVLLLLRFRFLILPGSEEFSARIDFFDGLFHKRIVFYLLAFGKIIAI